LYQAGIEDTQKGLKKLAYHGQYLQSEVNTPLDYDIFMEMLSYNDTIVQHQLGWEHIILNKVKQLLACITNRGSMKVTPQKRKLLGRRFPGLLKVQEGEEEGQEEEEEEEKEGKKKKKKKEVTYLLDRGPWSASEESIQAAEKVMTAKLRYPTTWGERPRPPSSDLAHLKIHDCFLYCGPVLAYYVEFLGIEEPYKELYIDLSYALSDIIAKSIPANEEYAASSHTHLMEVLTRWENLMPPWTWTLGTHMMQHVWTSLEERGLVRTLGPPSAWMMMSQERFMNKIKKSTHSSKHPEYSIAKETGMLENLTQLFLTRHTADPNAINPIYAPQNLSTQVPPYLQRGVVLRMIGKPKKHDLNPAAEESKKLLTSCRACWKLHDMIGAQEAMSYEFASSYTFKGFVKNGARFRNAECERHMKTCDSVVCVRYEDEKTHKDDYCYGVIEKVYELKFVSALSLAPSAPSLAPSSLLPSASYSDSNDSDSSDGDSDSGDRGHHRPGTQPMELDPPASTASTASAASSAAAGPTNLDGVYLQVRWFEKVPDLDEKGQPKSRLLKVRSSWKRPPGRKHYVRTMVPVGVVEPRNSVLWETRTSMEKHSNSRYDRDRRWYVIERNNQFL
jgi:hypothetical protein